MGTGGGLGSYLLVAGDASLDAFQLGVADVAELVLWHGDHAFALGDEPTTVLHKMAVVTGERLQDLMGRVEEKQLYFVFWIQGAQITALRFQT